MPTLAQRYLKEASLDAFEYCRPELKKMQDWTHKFIQYGLKLPSVGDDPEQCVERYVFEEDAPMLMMDLVESKSIDHNLVWETFAFPAKNFWIEYPAPDPDDRTRNITVGMMVGKTEEGRLMLAIVAGQTAVRPVALLSIPDDVNAYRTKNVTVSAHWFLDQMGGTMLEDAKLDINVFVYDMIDCVFLLNTPRVGEMRQSTFGSNRKVKPGRRGPDTPLIEYKRFVLHIGKAAPRYERTGDRSAGEGTGGKKKAHRVLPFFRTYREGRDVPKVVHVPTHWRGDPSLGIILHERVVKK